ncbi:MAG: hypothetical protein U9P79_09200 [Candidatus Cloacimonadota bacterium]|nr:hypothetical protein [Candidatus Cloacimonadota bacterium]
MTELYFTINLNKFGEAEREQIKEKKTFLKTVYSFAAAVLIFSIIAFLINSSLESKIQSRRRLLANIKKDIKQYKVSGEYLSTKDLKRMAQITTQRIFWAKKLVAFSQKMSDKIAITHFQYKNNVLSIFGITKVDRQQKEFNLINEFITILENNEHINSDFPEIKFVSSRKDYEKDVPILRFQIDCVTKTQPGGRR